MLGKSDSASEDYAAEYPYQPQAAAVLPILEAPDALMSAAGRIWQVLWLAAGLCFCFVVCDVAVAPLTWTFHQGDWGGLLAQLSFGAIMAQAGLLSCGFVFGPGPYWRRLLCFWLAAAICYALWAGGLMILWANRRLDSRELATWIRLGVCSAPLVAVAIQSPLWFFRMYRGWELAGTNSERRSKALAIRDYFIGTAVVACSIALARQGVPAKQVGGQFWTVWGMVMVIGGSLSLVSAIPAMLLMFRCDWRVGLIALTVYAAAVTSGFIAVAVYMGGPMIAPLQVVTGLVLMFVSFAVYLALGMKAMRDVGFCLVSRKKRTPRENENLAADERR